MEELECAMRALATLLRDEKTISWYEVHMSRLVPVLLHCLTGMNAATSGGVASGGGGTLDVGEVQEEKVETRVKLFKKMFVEASEELPPDLDAR